MIRKTFFTLSVVSVWIETARASAACSWCAAFEPDITTCGITDSSGWTLVRAIGPSKGSWFRNTDSLAGTDPYFDDNVDEYNIGSFSGAVSGYNQFLFTTGDCGNWLVTSTDAVNGAIYSNAKRTICSSSESPYFYQASWYNRGNNVESEDPWISTIDHGPAITTGKLVYGEDNFNWPSHTTANGHLSSGVFVYIRKADYVDQNLCAAEELTCRGGNSNHLIGGNGAYNDILGCGMTPCADRYRFTTVQQCNKWCVDTVGCLAYSWTGLNGDMNHMGVYVCTLYDSVTATSKWSPNQIMCTKCNVDAARAGQVEELVDQFLGVDEASNQQPTASVWMKFMALDAVISAVVSLLVVVMCLSLYMCCGLRGKKKMSYEKLSKADEYL